MRLRPAFLCAPKIKKYCRSGNYLWLNSVNQCRFIAHVPLDDEKTHVVVQPITGAFVDHLRDNTSKYQNRISAVFDTVSQTGSNQDQR
ncbi:unnamed protein product [Adineta ricciae]|uniref:Uncharacterized protein n=1 Tax=Adineta ricciae TaxID=249248 RepID=A0A816BCZ6_ADIRI|nr:unnamed protein product [Adineta ricciae]CAF1608420.1 unnamed protein product [Adineta ricciae]